MKKKNSSCVTLKLCLQIKRKRKRWNFGGGKSTSSALQHPCLPASDQISGLPAATSTAHWIVSCYPTAMRTCTEEHILLFTWRNMHCINNQTDKYFSEIAWLQLLITSSLNSFCNLQINCTINFLFYLYLILHADTAIFDVTFFKVWIFDLNKTSVNILFSPEHGFFMILLRSRCSRQIHDDVLNVMLMQLTKTVIWWPQLSCLSASLSALVRAGDSFKSVLVLHGHLQLPGLYDRTAPDEWWWWALWRGRDRVRWSGSIMDVTGTVLLACFVTQRKGERSRGSLSLKYPIPTKLSSH